MIAAIKQNFRIFTQSSRSIKQRVCTYSLDSATLFLSLALNHAVLSLCIWEWNEHENALSTRISSSLKDRTHFRSLQEKQREAGGGCNRTSSLFSSLTQSCLYVQRIEIKREKEKER